MTRHTARPKQCDSKQLFNSVEWQFCINFGKNFNLLWKFYIYFWEVRIDEIVKKFKATIAYITSHNNFSTLTESVINFLFIFIKLAKKMSHNESSTRSNPMLGNKMDHFFSIKLLYILIRFFWTKKIYPFGFPAIFIKSNISLRITHDNTAFQCFW